MWYGFRAAARGCKPAEPSNGMPNEYDLREPILGESARDLPIPGLCHGVNRRAAHP